MYMSVLIMILKKKTTQEFNFLFCRYSIYIIPGRARRDLYSFGNVMNTENSQVQEDTLRTQRLFGIIHITVTNKD